MIAGVSGEQEDREMKRMDRRGVNVGKCTTGRDGGIYDLRDCGKEDKNIKRLFTFFSKENIFDFGVNCSFKQILLKSTRLD